MSPEAIVFLDSFKWVFIIVLAAAAYVICTGGLDGPDDPDAFT